MVANHLVEEVLISEIIALGIVAHVRASVLVRQSWESQP